MSPIYAASHCVLSTPFRIYYFTAAMCHLRWPTLSSAILCIVEITAPHRPKHTDENYNVAATYIVARAVKGRSERWYQRSLACHGKVAPLTACAAPCSARAT